MSGAGELLLAVDTSGSRAGAVLAGDGRCETGYLDLRPGGFARTEDLSALAGDLMARWGCSAPDLTLLGAVVGPGSYTGLRSGLAFVRGMAFPRGLPAVGAGSLELLAWQGAVEGERVVVAAASAAAGFALSTCTRGKDVVEAAGNPELVAEDALAAVLESLAGEITAVVVAAAPGGRGTGETAGAATQESAIAAAARSAGLELRTASDDALAALADLLLARRRRQGVASVDTLLPVYVGETRARPNRDRVVLAARPE